MMKNRSSYIFLVMCVILQEYVRPSNQFEMDSIGRVVRGHLGTLYDLRSKLGGSSVSSSGSVSTTSTTTAQPSNPLKKESRGYAFHYSSSAITHPMYTSSSKINQDFHSRMGKVSDSPSASSISNNKWKNSADKYSKLAYKTVSSSASAAGKDSAPLNSFNIHEADSEPYVSTNVKSNSNDNINDNSKIDSNINTNTNTKSKEKPVKKTTAAPEIKTTSLPIISPTTTTTAMPSTSINLGPLKQLTQGLNSAMTTVLTHKLMNILDQDAPPMILNPFRHLVASGGRMVDFWDKRTNARDGKSPGIVEMMGYGLDQLKKFRDGQQFKSTDSVNDMTSASKSLITGMVTIKKLTNRVLGYDTDEVAMESRGGYGHDSYGGGGYGGGHASYGGSYGGLDPFSLLAALAFGAFLLQLLLTMMSTSARSLDVSDLNTPLLMSDFHVPNFVNAADRIFGTPTVRSKRDADDEEDGFSSIVDKLDGVFKTYQQITEKPRCVRLYLCRIAVQDAMGDENSMLAQLYMFGLGHLAKDKSATQFVKALQKRVADGEDINCDKIVKECVPKGL